MKVFPFDYETADYSSVQLAKYERFKSREGHWYEKWLVLRDMVGDVHGKTVVDLGCSIGTYTMIMSERGGLAVGIDFSGQAVRCAGQLAAREGRGGFVSFVQGDVTQLPVASGSVDLVTGVDIAEHLLPDALGRMMSEMRRVLKQGGRLVLQTYPNRYSYFFHRFNKYTLLAVPALILPRRCLSGYFRRADGLCGKLKAMRNRIRGVAFIPSHCNCQTPESISQVVTGAGFLLEGLIVQNTYSSYERTTHSRWWEKALGGHVVTRNNLYLTAVKR